METSCSANSLTDTDTLLVRVLNMLFQTPCSSNTLLTLGHTATQAEESTKTKTCSRCKLQLPVSGFCRNHRSADKLSSQCRKCAADKVHLCLK